MLIEVAEFPAILLVRAHRERQVNHHEAPQRSPIRGCQAQVRHERERNFSCRDASGARRRLHTQALQFFVNDRNVQMELVHQCNYESLIKVP